MKNRRTYFVLNREAEFKRGYCSGTTINSGKITLEDKAADGIYYTRIFDSRERLTEWHRLRITGHFYGDASAAVTVYASDSPYHENSGESFREIICDGKKPQNEKDEILKPYCRAKFFQPRDVLLYSVKGRYLWIKIELKAQGDYVPDVERIQIYFPKHTWLSHLPEIYQENPVSASFLERYLGIFQSIQDDMTEKIEQIPALFEPENRKQGLLYELADWFCVEHKNFWTESQLVYLVKNAGRIASERGTALCLKEMVKLYTGREPYIVEYYQIKPFFDSEQKEMLLKKLYTSGPFEFAVLLEDENISANNRFMILRQIIDSIKPAHMECRIIVLKPYIFLDQHTYIGINSVLGQYKALALDGLCAVPFSVVSEGKGDESK